MLLSALAALGTVGASIYGAVQSGKLSNTARNMLTNQHNENQTWYNNQLASDYVTRSDYQNILSKQKALLEQQYKNARATNIVAGGTDASLAALQDSINQNQATTTGNIAANASSYKDNLANARMQDNNTYANNMANINMKQAQQVADAAGQVSSAMGGLAKSDNTTLKQDWSWLMGSKS